MNRPPSYPSSPADQETLAPEPHAEEAPRPATMEAQAATLTDTPGAHAVADTIPWKGPGVDGNATLPFMGGATQNGDEKDTEAFHQAALAAAGSFGDYQLLEPIAKGGMGVVYKALQRKLNRIVAVKMILAGHLADQEDLDRFYAEAEAAAALSHPNIVAIHEIGEFEGQHFFSMDYVPGKSLAALVRANPLPPRRAAELMRTIAETMQFAHDSGIVHRDLKPSNVLLDRKERPLITDFGLAKHATNHSQHTQDGSIIGTPSYMPPEQASGNVQAVGTWSDVYSLGAILYELLTGRPPFRAATTMETIRQVLESEPPSPRLLNPQVPKDLETICLKCLQKPRASRYGSAQALADELGRFLNGVPIQARPISKLDRLWRLCKRHPIAATAIASAAGVLMAATAVSSAFYIRESIARGVAVRRRDDAMQVLDKFVTRVSEGSLLNEPGKQKERRELLQEALAWFQRFLDDGGNDPSVRDQLAKAHFNVGRVTALLKSRDDALESYLHAQQIQERLLALKPSDPMRLEALGNTLVAAGNIRVMKRDFEAARCDYERALEVRGKLALIKPSDVEYQRVLANTFMNLGLMEREAAISSDDDAKFKDGLQRARQRFEKSQQVRLAALEREPTNLKLRRDLGKCYFNFGNLDWDGSDNASAEKHFKSAAAEFEKVVADPAHELSDGMQLGVSCALAGDSLRQSNQHDEARTWYQRGLTQLSQLTEKNPDVIEYQTEQAGLLMSLFELEAAVENHAAAAEDLDRARGIYAKLADRFPAVPDYQRDLAIALRELARQQAPGPNLEAARENLGRAIAILTAISSQYPDHLEFAAQLERAKSVELLASP